MSFFSNKHVITAMIVAPLLAVGAWYLVDLLVKEKPSPALEGQAYPLVAKSNCRYTSGSCDLVNAEFKSQVLIHSEGGEPTLVLNSNHALQRAMVGFVTDGGVELAPVAMIAASADKRQWQTRLTVNADENTTMRIALLANNSQYFAETTLGFGEYKTTFHKDFRK